MIVDSYFSQIVVAREGHVIGCFWNNSRRFLFVWGMFQFFRTTAVKFSTNRLYVNINKMRFGSCFSRSLFCSRLSLTNLPSFLIAHQQVSGCNLALKVSLSIFLSDLQNLSWLVSFFLFVAFKILFFQTICMLQVRKSSRVCFLSKCLGMQLVVFNIYLAVWKKILSFDISHLNLIDGCFAFKLFNNFSLSVLLLVHIKNILSNKPEIYK